jgi:serine/threonine-protein kinase
MTSDLVDAAPEPVDERPSSPHVRDWEIDGCVDHRWMGEVFRVTRRVSGSKGLLEIVTPSFARDPVFRNRYLRVAELTGKIDSPHVAPVIDYGVTDEGWPFRVLRLTETETLSSILSRGGSVGVTVAAMIARQVLSGLTAVHDAGLLQLFLSDESIVLSRPRGGLLARIAEAAFGPPADLDGSIVGATPYIAPEQLRAAERDEGLDARADVYSAGVLLYKMVTGGYPHEPPSSGRWGEVLDERVSLPPDPLARRAHGIDLPDGFEPVVMRALCTEPRNRYRSAAELARALSPFAHTTALELLELVGETVH